MLKSLPFHKPNPSNKGHLFSFNVGKTAKDKGLSLYLEATKQNGWDAVKKLGAFKGGDKISTKFNELEIARILTAIEEDFPQDLTFFHSFDASGKQIFFSKKDLNGKIGYVLTINKKPKVFSMAFAYEELVLLREYLKVALVEMFQKDITTKEINDALSHSEVVETIE